MIGRRSCEQQQPDISAIETGIFESHIPGGACKVGECLVLTDVTTRLDASAPLDPPRLQAKPRLDDVIGDANIRRVMAKTGNFDAARRPLVDHADTSRATLSIAAYTLSSSLFVVQ